MPGPSHPPRLYYSNYTWRRVQTTKLFIMQFSPFSCRLISYIVAITVLCIIKPTVKTRTTCGLWEIKLHAGFMSRTPKYSSKTELMETVFNKSTGCAWFKTRVPANIFFIEVADTLMFFVIFRNTNLLCGLKSSSLLQIKRSRFDSIWEVVSGGRSVGIVRSRTQAKDLFCNTSNQTQS
jgi:hypothetical protein